MTICPQLNLKKEADFAFEGHDLDLLTRPIVYGWYRNGNFLYIGKGARGIGRPFTYDHHVIGKAEPFLNNDKLLIWVKPNEESALIEEGKLIRYYKPLYNKNKYEDKVCLNCKITFHPSVKCNKQWKKFCSIKCFREYKSCVHKVD